MHCVCEVWHVLGGDSRHGNATVLGQVDGELGGELLHLGRSHSREAEHADLVSDVRPVATGTLLGQVLLQLGAHRDDTVSHTLDVLKPGIQL